VSFSILFILFELGFPKQLMFIATKQQQLPVPTQLAIDVQRQFVESTYTLLLSWARSKT